jgi:hypothetical protein
MGKRKLVVDAEEGMLCRLHMEKDMRVERRGCGFWKMRGWCEERAQYPRGKEFIGCTRRRKWVDMDGKVFGPPPEVEERKVMTECQKSRDGMSNMKRRHSSVNTLVMPGKVSRAPPKRWRDKRMKSPDQHHGGVWTNRW